MGDLEAGLLEWSGRLAKWQRDLLRRLAAGEAIGKDDFRVYADATERIELEKKSPWYTKPEFGDNTVFTPLGPTHLTATVQGGDPVRIVKVIHIHGANDLADGASLVFNPVGLTMVAGRNGSGKSGYTRILKHGFRAGDKAPMAVMQLVDREAQLAKAAETLAETRKPKTAKPETEAAEKPAKTAKAAKKAKAEKPAKMDKVEKKAEKPAKKTKASGGKADKQATKKAAKSAKKSKSKD